METNLQNQLDTLKSSLLSMAALVEEQIARAISALVKHNIELCNNVISSDQPINMMELEIDDQCFRLLALQNPIASDLRFVTTSMKITIDLERMGDIAVNIAKKTKELIERPDLKPLIDIPQLADLAQTMVTDSLNAFVRGDNQLALQICSRDNEVDQWQDQILEELLEYMVENPSSAPQVLQLIFISRNIERIADHATNIAEGVVFYSEGRVIKHHADDDLN